MDDLITWLKAQLEICVAEADEVHNRDCDSTSDCCYLPGPCDCGIPARVLREVQAKRRRITLHEDVHDCPGIDWGSHEAGDPCPTLRLEALPFDDRPGYRSEWAL